MHRGNTDAQAVHLWANLIPTGDVPENALCVFVCWPFMRNELQELKSLEVQGAFQIEKYIRVIGSGMGKMIFFIHSAGIQYSPMICLHVKTSSKYYHYIFTHLLESGEIQIKVGIVIEIACKALSADQGSALQRVARCQALQCRPSAVFIQMIATLSCYQISDLDLEFYQVEVGLLKSTLLTCG